ncbi:MAG: hypothetical protein Q4G16_01105 [Cruoricaptor ignavus]|nr:hypothetical protein [Cruoricaptor ignavus]
MRYVFFLFLFFSLGIKSQILKPAIQKSVDDTLVIDNGDKDSVKIFKPTIADYKYRTQNSEYKIFDTTFTVQKSYALTQYNNQDNFGRIQFANIGSGFQDLVYRHNPEQNLTLLPSRKTHFILGINDIRYYDVKTPTTSFIYHTAMRNGAALQSTYTQNIGENFNFAVEYMGLRSEGFYTNSLAANNNTIFSGHYISNNKKYEAFAHFIHQNVNNEEYGGITTLSEFLNGDSQISNRANLTVNLNGSDSKFSYRRYYFSQNFSPFNSEKIPFKMSHTIFHQGNKYYFNLGSSDGGAFESINPQLTFNNKKYSENLSNTVNLVFDNEKFLLNAGVRYQNIVLGAENQIINSTEFAREKITENRLGAVGNLKINLWDKLSLNSFLEFSNGKQFGNFLRSANQLKFEPIKGYFVDAKINLQNSAPSFNYLLNISPVMNYTYNFTDFKNENILEIGGTVGLKWFDAKLFANYFRIDNYAYFSEDGRPNQSSTSLNISQIGGEADFSYRKFHLNTRLHFQSNLSNKDLLPTPNFIGRANIYWQTKAFKNAAEIMTGLKLYYFSKFDSRDFAPVINEFILPNSRAYAIGGQPIADAYFNLRVKTMQFYIEGQNITTTFMQNKSYTVPYYPLYDFRLNIGIVWQMFH